MIFIWLQVTQQHRWSESN